MTEQDPMTAAAPAYKADQASPERAETQVGAAWPKPGDEGYVHPDGTPQAAAQLQANRQAAQDRAAVGSLIHGAPAVERGGNPDASAVAAQRAEAYSGPSNVERDKAVTEHVRDGQESLSAAAPAEDRATPPVKPTRQGGAAQR